MVIIIPIFTNSFIFLVYDGYLKKSPEKLTANEKILYEKFFEYDLDSDNKLTPNLYVSFTEGDTEIEESSDIQETKRKKSLNFSESFLRNTKEDTKKKKIESNTSLDKNMNDTVSSPRSSYIGVSEEKHQNKD